MAERALSPEFNFLRHDAVSIPVGRARYFAEAKSEGVERDGLFEFEAIVHGLRLVRGPGADLTQSRTGRKIRIGFGGRGGFDRAFDADLAFEFCPMKAQRDSRIGGEITAFGTGGVGVKNKSVRVGVFQ